MNSIYIPDFQKDLIEQNQLLVISTNHLRNQDNSHLVLKPFPEKWSVMECFEHMNILYEIYLQNIRSALRISAEKYRPAQYFKPTIIGHYFYMSMAPNNNRKPRYKIKTFSRFKPKGESVDCIDLFLRNQSEFIELIHKIPEWNLDKIKVNSSVGSIIRFKLGDTFRIVTGHNLRHLSQAENAHKTALDRIY